MGNRLALRNTAVHLSDIAKRTRVSGGNTVPWSFNRTGDRLPGIRSRIRIALAGSGIQKDGTCETKTSKNDNFPKEFRSGVGNPVKNIFMFHQGWFHELPKKNKNSAWDECLASISFGEDDKDDRRRTSDKLVLNASVAGLSTIAFLFGFAIFSGVSASTNPKHETSPEDDEDSHYSQESSQRMDEEEFFFEGGTAVRDEEFKFVWKPKDPDNPKDCVAAKEAARKEAEKKANSLPKNKRPNVIGIIVSLKGHAMGGHSIRGSCAKDKFDRKMHWEQRYVLDGIAKEERGVGHGFCAEQAFTHNLKVIRRRQLNYPEEDRMFEGICFSIAYRRNKETEKYDIPIAACKSCRITNQHYGFLDVAMTVLNYANYIWCLFWRHEQLRWERIKDGDVNELLKIIFGLAALVIFLLGGEFPKK